MNNKIGVGVITCDREEYFKKCIVSIPDNVELVVVNDGTAYDSTVYPARVKELIQHTANKSVGVSKNEAMRHLIQTDCDHIFLIEDDTEILNAEVFEKYIRTAEASGIWHMNYGPGSPLNRKQDEELLKRDLEGRAEWDENAEIKPRAVIPYDSGEEVALYKHCAGCFSYFYRGVIKAVGYHDEHFNNAWEHVDLAYRVIKKGLHPPFWWFADIANSTDYINDMAGSIVQSSITKDQTQWKKNIEEGAKWYHHKHGHYPAQVQDTHPDVVLSRMEQLQERYARGVL